MPLRIKKSQQEVIMPRTPFLLLSRCNIPSNYQPVSVIISSVRIVSASAFIPVHRVADF